ncbi:MAG: DUF5615 family PIN-like protein [Firmicutes bacterium]|nr:DUF5615 family PIN-like protein [Bacillota bacterium]
MARTLRQLGHEVDLAAPGVPDEAILKEAARTGAVVVTCDKDFGKLVFDTEAEHTGVV